MKILRPSLIILAIILLPVAAASVIADTLTWKPPTERENGEKMDLSEVGGYELHGFDAFGNRIWQLVTEDGKRTSYDAPDGPVTFKIAAYDADGLFSEFVTITPSKLLPPGQGVLERPGQGWLER